MPIFFFSEFLLCINKDFDQIGSDQIRLDGTGTFKSRQKKKNLCMDPQEGYLQDLVGFYM